MAVDGDGEKLRKAALEATGAELISEPHVNGIRVAGWRILSTKRPILSAEDIESWETRLETRHLPEMVFGNNSLELQHESTGIRVCFNAFDALSEWKRENLPPVEVPAAAKWRFRSKPSEEVILDYDYTFTTPYCGSQCLGQSYTKKQPSVCEGEDPAFSNLEWTSCDSKIDFVGLQIREPILFYDEVILYEDELADNGIAFLSVKVRVMPSCWFLLLRYWLRVDGVLMRLRDTRMFSSFQNDPQQPPFVIRERCQREDTFQALALKGYIVEPSMYQDPSAVGDRLQIQAQYYEKLPTWDGTEKDINS